MKYLYTDVICWLLSILTFFSTLFLKKWYFVLIHICCFILLCIMGVFLLYSKKYKKDSGDIRTLNVLVYFNFSEFLIFLYNFLFQK